VNHLYEDLRDGIILLQVLDKLQPGIVNWSKVNKRPNPPQIMHRLKQVENCNYVTTLSKQLGFSLVGIGGSDIQEANKKLTLAVVWQMMRFYVLNFLKNLSKTGKEITDNDIITWCNQKVRSAGKPTQMDSFQDRSLSDARFLLDLLGACQPASVDYGLVTPGSTDEDKRLNAQYAISCARKMGCTVFLLWEDIVEVKPKMMMTFFGAVMSTFGSV